MPLIDVIHLGDIAETQFNQRRVRAAIEKLNLFIQRWVHCSLSGLKPLCRFSVNTDSILTIEGRRRLRTADYGGVYLIG